MPAQPQPTPSRAGIRGITFPKPPPGYCVPVGCRAPVIQGNGGSYSHTDEWTRYAWDFDLPIGSPVVAARAGVVIYARDESSIGGENRERYIDESNTIIIDHLDGTHAVYLHLAKGGNRVRVGEYVLRGEAIARSGDTGWAGVPHLHYTIRAAKGQQSLASSFSDFRPNEGVPREEDVVAAAPPPAVPQPVIHRVKTAWHASREAERLGLIGLAWELSGAGTDARHPDYFYTQVVALWREALHLRTTERLVKLAKTTAPTAAEMLEARRLLVTIPRGGKVFRVERNALAEAVKRWPEEARFWAAEIRALKEWVRGLRKECTGDRIAALGYYRLAVKRAGRRFKPTARAALHRVIAYHLRVANRNFNRLGFEADHVRAKHRERLRADAAATFAVCKSLTAAWRETYRRDKREVQQADAALAAARERYRKVLGKLSG